VVTYNLLGYLGLRSQTASIERGRRCEVCFSTHTLPCSCRDGKLADVQGGGAKQDLLYRVGLARYISCSVSVFRFSVTAIPHMSRELSVRRRIHFVLTTNPKQDKLSKLHFLHLGFTLRVKVKTKLAGARARYKIFLLSLSGVAHTTPQNVFPGARANFC
jgi:hypothetical protein